MRTALGDRIACGGWTGLLLIAWTIAAPALAAEPTEADRLAARQLRHGAVNLLHADPQTTGRAGRIFSLLLAAREIDPGAPETCRLLGDAYAVQGEMDKAVAAAESCLEAHPEDFALAKRWLDLRIGRLQTAADRIDACQKVLERADLTDELKAVAAVGLAEIRLGRGESPEAHAMLGRALRLDPHNPDALRLKVERDEHTPASQHAALLLQLHEGRPRDLDAAVRASAALGELGLYDRALELLDYVGRLRERLAVGAGRIGYLSARCNALLDAGQPQKVVELVTGIRDDTLGGELDLPLAEAYRALDREDQARRLLSRVEQSYTRALEQGPLTADLATEVAWFYLLHKPDAKRAMALATTASKLQPDHPLTQRVLGVALIRSGETAKGMAMLEPLASRDAFAAAFLAETHFRQGDPDAAVAVVEHAWDTGLSGPAARKLRAVAAELAKTTQREIDPPTPPGAEDAQAAFSSTAWVRAATLNPASTLQLVVRTVRDNVDVGEAIELTATLTGTAENPLPLGPVGVVNPVASLRAVTGSGREYPDLPLAVWRSGRHLPPGAQLTATVRVDVGALEAALQGNPLAQGPVSVTATLDPITDAEGKVVSSIPGVRADAAVFVRRSLVTPPARDEAALWRRAYLAAINRLNRIGSEGDLGERVLAARQVGAILALAMRIQKGDATLPPMLSGMSIKPDALELYRSLLVDRSPVVRSEMIASLLHVPMTAEVLRPLGPRFDDPSWLVRLRAAEVIGATRSTGRRTILDYLARDKVEVVRRMAKAFPGHANPR